MLNAILNAWKVPDIRKKIIFTFFILALYRLGAHITVPGIDARAIAQLAQGGVLGFLDLFSGGGLTKFAIFALGIMPYITSSIIMQLLTIVIPKLEQWAKEGETGQRKITQITRYTTVGLAFMQSIAFIFYFRSASAQMKTSIFPHFDFLHVFLIVISLTSGTALVMWLGELITQRGVSNGISILIFASIISRLPQGFGQFLKLLQIGQLNPFISALFGIIALGIIAGVIWVQEGQRRIPVQYAKRVVGRKMYGGQSTYIPLKVNMAGVIPVIFASSILIFPGMIANFIPTPFFRSVTSFLSPTNAPYLALFFILIIFFTYFYTAIQFNPLDYADNLRKYGGYIPGIRPGKPTAQFLDRVLTRITLPGAIFLGIVAIIPQILIAILNIPFYFGGTALLIVVGVALETMKQLESQLLMRHYEGFLK